MLGALAGCWAAPAIQAVAPPHAASGDLATAEAVLEASLVAQGGRAALGRIVSSRSTGSLITPNGVIAKLTIQSATPRSVLTTIEVPGLQTIRQGVSGDIVWETSGLGPRILTGSERAQQLREAAVGADADWKTLYTQTTLEGVVAHARGHAYKIVQITPEGDRQTRYFAHEQQRVVGEEMIAASRLGTIPVVTTFSDYRAVAGTRHPHHVQRVEGAEGTMTIQLDTIEINPTIPSGTFELPAEIAALAK
ncbi:MAG: hypothetical protein H0T79_02020 [Deltaproteobacteria bacterium]|nr:hypothetical protein [Deltaproteobacteria bacterium]